MSLYPTKALYLRAVEGRDPTTIRQCSDSSFRRPAPKQARAPASSTPPTATSKRRCSCRSARRGPSKASSPRDLLNDLDAKIILGNTYHLFLRPGHETIRKLGGLHKFMTWPRAILTDSGGFQVFSLGYAAQGHRRRRPVPVAPERRSALLHARIDRRRPAGLGSDIMMVLDECLAYPASHEAARVSMRTDAALGARRLSTTIEGSQTTATSMRSFPIVQGSMYPDLRRHCAEELLRAGRRRLCDRRAFGRRAPRAESGNDGGHRAAAAAGRPRYVMGVGMPDELPEYVARGVDMMDCVLPSRNARNGYLFTSAGTSGHQAGPVQGRPAPGGSNPAPATLAATFRGPICAICFWRRDTFSTLATLHNLRRYLDIMRQMRQAILVGEFPDVPACAARQRLFKPSGNLESRINLPMQDLAFWLLQQSAPAASNPIISFLPLIFIVAIFYFLVFMPMQRQKKQQAAMLAGLQAGNEVVTTGGIVGTIVSVTSGHLDRAREAR